jgi:hypothetical protein
LNILPNKAKCLTRQTILSIQCYFHWKQLAVVGFKVKYTPTSNNALNQMYIKHVMGYKLNRLNIVTKEGKEHRYVLNMKEVIWYWV